ncbi:MAG: ADP-ribose pyrophosphatase [Chlamydiia bacterium]|nr:ADP-ribose pyrophosphatase [Chlamydiia bacterium]
MARKDTKAIRKRLVYEGFFDFREDILLDHNQQEYQYNFLVAKAEACAILPEIEENKFVLNYEYRYPVGRTILSCPGGRLDEGEDPVFGAKRELLEETGYEAKEMINLHLFYPFPSVCDQRVHLFLAKGLTKVAEPNLDPLEEIETKILTMQDIKKLDYEEFPADGVLHSLLFHRNLYLSD